MDALESEATSIDKLCSEIGKERTARVLEFALPRIVGFENDLREYLLAGDRKSASDCAHRAVSSVRAYGTRRLEKLLRQVGDENTDYNRLQPELSGEFTLVIGQVESWLREYV